MNSQSRAIYNGKVQTILRQQSTDPQIQRLPTPPPSSQDEPRPENLDIAMEDASEDSDGDMHEIHIHAATDVDGDANRVTIESCLIGARTACSIAQLLGGVRNSSVQTTPRDGASHVMYGRAADGKKLKIVLDCGVSVRGTQNVVGGVELAPGQYMIKRVGPSSSILVPEKRVGESQATDSQAGAKKIKLNDN